MSEPLGQSPFGAYHFDVTIDDEHIAYPFRSCSGLREESSVVELEEGGFNDGKRQLIGPTSRPPIVLKRGFCSANSELYKRRRRVVNDAPSGQPPERGRLMPSRFAGTITQLGPNGTEAKWRFISAFISKWEGPDFDAAKNEISIESIEIRHEGLLMLKEPAKAKGR